MASKSFLFAAFLGCCWTFSGCGSETPSEDDPWGPGKADALVYDGTPQAIGLLRFLNDASTSFEVIDVDAALDRRAAVNLIEHRDGPDGVPGTGDDDPFDSVGEVDDVSYVGIKAMEKLIAYATLQGWVPTGNDLLGVYDGVPFTVLEANAVVDVVNAASFDDLDVEAELDRRAADSIVEARPVRSVAHLASLSYVGKSALTKLKTYSLASSQQEIGIISDLDKTVIPPHSYDEDPLPEAPYPGVTALYNSLEFRDEGYPGDMYYVTARTADRIEGIAEWLESHGLPAGPIEPGVDSYWQARQEKVDDMSAILEANPGQTFILFGDSSHVDPEVMHDVMELYADRIVAGLVHLVNNPNPDRLEGLHPHHNYAEAAAILFSLSELSEDDTRGVMTAARLEGLDITEAEIDELIESHRP